MDLRKSIPMIQKSDGSFEPVESIDLKSSEPVWGIKDAAKATAKAMAGSAIDSVLGMPLMDSFRPNTPWGGDTPKAFKWFILGMPDDIEGIRKAETMSWADLGEESSIVQQAKELTRSNIDRQLLTPFDLTGKVKDNIFEMLSPEIRQQYNVARDTVMNIPYEVLGDLAEIYTDPRKFLSMVAIGYGIGKTFQGIPAWLNRVKGANPHLYRLLTKEIGKQSQKVAEAYKVLGVDKDAPMVSVVKKYRSETVKNHPDRGGDPLRYEAVQDAFKTIKNSTEKFSELIVKSWRGSRFGSTRGGIPHDLILQYKLTPNQIANIEGGNLANLPKKLVDELTKIGTIGITDKVEQVGKERGFVTSVKEELPDIKKVGGQYIPRSTDTLSIKAKNLIKDNIKVAEKMALEGVDDSSVATGSELLKEYNRLALEEKNEAIKDSIYEKAATLANSMAVRLTELGRSVQAAVLLSKLTPEGQVRFAAKEIQRYNEKVVKDKGGLLGLRKQIPELTPEQTKDIFDRMKIIQDLPPGEEKAIMFKKLRDDISNLVPTPFMDKIVTVWKAGLLTGVKTSGLNIASNASHLISEVIKDVPATALDVLLSPITGKRTTALTVKGITAGFKEGVEKGIRFLRTGYDERNAMAKYDYKKVNYGKSKIGKAVQAYTDKVFNILGSEDQPFYYGALLRSFNEQAIVEAINKGLSGDEAKAFVDNLVHNPTDKMLVLSVEDALVAVYQNETILGRVAKQFQNIGPVGQFILPFGRTPSAVATQIIHYTPVGAINTLIQNIGKDRFNQRKFVKGIGRGLTGTAIMGLGAYLIRKGLMNLDYPTSESDRELWKLEGRKPNTIKIGGRYRQIQSFGPLGNVLLIGGHYYNAFKETGSIIGALAIGSFGAIKSFSEQTFLTSLKGSLEAMTDPEKSAASFIRSFVSSAVPTLIKDVAVATDDIVRRPTTMVDYILNRVPALRQMLEPQVDILGQEVKRAENFFETMFDFTRGSAVKDDPIIKEFRRLKDLQYDVHLSKIGTKKGYKSLTPEENTELLVETGRAAYHKISDLMNRGGYDNIEDDVKAKRINKYFDEAKETARLNIALKKTEGLKGIELRDVLEAMIKDKLLTRSLYKEFSKMR